MNKRELMERLDPLPDNTPVTVVVREYAPFVENFEEVTDFTVTIQHYVDENGLERHGEVVALGID